MTYEIKTANQAGQDQLDAVAAEFDDWRRNKKAHSERIPLSLLREAQKLTEHLGVTAVRRKLGITKGQMDKVNDRKTSASGGTSDFMQLVPAESREAAPAHLTIDICLPSGLKVSLSGLAQNDPLALIAKLIEG